MKYWIPIVIIIIVFLIVWYFISKEKKAGNGDVKKGVEEIKTSMDHSIAEETSKAKEQYKEIKEDLAVKGAALEEKADSAKDKIAEDAAEAKAEAEAAAKEAEEKAAKDAEDAKIKVEAVKEKAEKDAAEAKAKAEAAAKEAEEKIKTAALPVMENKTFELSELAKKSKAGETVLDKKGKPINPEAFDAIDEAGLYKTGKIPGKGHYVCARCGKEIFLNEDTDRLPPCGKCHNNRFTKKD